MISVIIPVKGHRIVEKLLKKLVSVEFPEKHEVLIVDSAPGLLKDLRSKYKNVRWVDCDFSKYQSVPEQRNFGIQRAKGDIIVFIDADCIPTKKWVVNLIKPILSGEEQITCGWVKSVRKYPRKWAVDHSNKPDVIYVSFAPTMNSAFRKSVFKKVGWYDHRFSYGAEDVDYCWRVIQLGYKIKYCPDAIVFHDWGDAKRNIFRMFAYGKASFLFFEKHFDSIRKSPRFLYGIIAYPIFILGLPLTIISPMYLCLFILPFLRTLIDTRSLYYAFENAYFNFIYGIGFLFGAFEFLKLNMTG